MLSGTPITFKRYTGRKYGWVGGFPQTSLFNAFHPKLASNVWLVGDSIFPGQSTAAVALGGLRVAKAILADLI
jgi:phytoene dehydrogenase-like protein